MIMGLNSEGQQVHRPGPFKQSNKKHKSGKSTGRSSQKGRVDVKTISRSNKLSLKRADRKHQANQLRKKKRDAVLSKKRGFGSAASAPILVAVIPLGCSADPLELLKKLEGCADGIEVYYNDYGHCHIRFPQQKQRFTFFMPRFGSIHEVMDAAKVADCILFIHSTEPYDDYTEMLLSVILAHALPSSVHVLPDLEKLPPKKKSEVKKEISKKIESRFPDEKIFHVDTRQELQLLLRQIGCQKDRPVGFRDARPHLISEKAEFINENPEVRTGTLKVYGYIRGKSLDVNSLVHIPGYGNFQMSAIHYEEDPCSPPRKRTSSSVQDDTMLDEPLVPDPSLQQSLQSEVIPDPVEYEEMSLHSEEASRPKKRKIVKKVPEGTSEYQAAWIVGSDVEEEISETDDDDESCTDSLVTAAEDFSERGDVEDMETVDGESQVDDDDYEEAKGSTNPAEYDQDINVEEERKMLVRFKEERMEQMFPDEVDTPLDVPARVRYQKYRGLKNFMESEWDPMEDLPIDYGRIYRFENFRLTKKRVFAAEDVGAAPGSYVSIHVLNVPLSILEEGDTCPLVVFGLLNHEQKTSVVNALIKKRTSCTIPIKSKDHLIFHVGFRRFVCQPIFSVIGRGNKFKYEKFLPSGTAVMASFFAPVTFPPASVIVFRQKTDGQVELVASGSIVNVDPNRVVVKRIVLSGHPFRIFKKSAVVRYMFFNPEDIEYFKKVELRTKCGRKGHIKESLGSHGHMKCVFDRQLQSQDTVLMTLYKRVFPEWTYDPSVPTPVSPYEQHNEDMLI